MRGDCDEACTCEVDPKIGPSIQCSVLEECQTHEQCAFNQTDGTAMCLCPKGLIRLTDGR